jgi:hypothetical protein
MSLLIVGRSGGEFVIANLSRKTKNAVCGVRDGIRSVRKRSAIGHGEGYSISVNHGRGQRLRIVSSLDQFVQSLNARECERDGVSLGNNEAALRVRCDRI